MSNEGEEIIRVAVVDDQRLFARALSGLVELLPGVEVVGVAYNGEEAIALCRKEEPDVVLMDISMPKMDGISATREIKALLPRTAVVILTGHEEDEHVFEGIKAGAQSYLLKDSEPEDLSRAIHTVVAGDAIIAPDLAQKMLTTFEDGRPWPPGGRAALRGQGNYLRPGDPDDHLYFLLSGTVRLYKIYGDYKEATTALLTEGDIFGELSLEKTPRQTTFAEAVTDARVAVVRKSVPKEAIKRLPEFALQLFSSFSERFRQSDQTIGSLLNREVSARLVTLLSHLGERFGEPDGSATLIKVRLTHQDLANMIFSTREAVSKEMSEFQRAGLIEMRNRRISVNLQPAKEDPDERRSNAGEAA